MNESKQRMTDTSTSTTTGLTNLSSAGRPRWQVSDQFLIGVLVVCTLGLYFRTRHFDFVSYDDQVYVSDNVHLLHGLSGDSLHWAMTAIVSANWHPLTLLTELIIATLFGRTPGAFHVSNAILHSINVGLLFLFLRKSTNRQWPAFFVAALWGLHPLRVESVAWISELKDVLCGMFWLLCMLAYLHYSQRRTIGRFAAVLLLNALALLAKPMACTLPMALLLVDFWPIESSQRKSTSWWGRRIAEKLPLIALGLFDMLMALQTQRRYVGSMSATFPLALRCENALVSIVAYLGDIFLPHDLVVFYPHPAMLGPHGQPIAISACVFAAVLLLGLSGIAIWRLKSQPYLLIGWLWFLGTLAPVLGLVQVGEQQRADRYTYLPSIGITFAVVFWMSDLLSYRRVLQWLGVAGAIVAAVALAISASLTIDHWRDTSTLFGSLRQVQPDNYVALALYAEELTGEKQIDRAEEIARQAVRIAPRSTMTHKAYGLALRSAKRFDEALNEFLIARTLSPNEYESWDGLGSVRDGQATLAEARNQTDVALDLRLRAIDDFKNAIKATPDSVQSREHLAYQLTLVPGHLDEAIGIWNQAVEMDPGYAQAQGDLASALLLKGDVPQAIEHFQAAIADGSKNPDWETKLAWLIATSPQATFADVLPMVALAKDACDQTRNQQAAALDAYADCLARVTRFDDAVQAAQQAITAANASHEPAVAAGIQKRLELYEKGRAYVATSEQDRHAGKPATTQATTDKTMNDKR